MVLEDLATWRLGSLLLLTCRKRQLPVTCPLAVSRFCKAQESALSPMPVWNQYSQRKEDTLQETITQRQVRGHTAIVFSTSPYTCQIHTGCQVLPRVSIKFGQMGKRKSHKPHLNRSHKILKKRERERKKKKKVCESVSVYLILANKMMAQRDVLIYFP